MPALTYEDLGGISAATTNPKVPASKRSRDANRWQRIAFEANPTRPFTGIIHVQAAVGDPTMADGNRTWFDLAEMVINNEGGTWSYEFEGEFANIRVVCKTGNYWSAAEGTTGAVVGLAGDFTINGNVIAVNPGDNAATVANTINTDGNVITDGTIVADVINSTALRIYKRDGASLVLADTTNSPLADLGFTPGTFTGGAISAIRMLR